MKLKKTPLNGREKTGFILHNGVLEAQASKLLGRAIFLFCFHCIITRENVKMCKVLKLPQHDARKKSHFAVGKELNFLFFNIQKGIEFNITSGVK